MFLYKSILYSALTFAHTRGLQQKLLLKIMEILTFLFAFDWINLQYFKPLKRDLKMFTENDAVFNTAQNTFNLKWHRLPVALEL